MIVRRLYDTRLAQASYLIGCGASGEAIVIDPHRDIGMYLEVAAAEKVRIAHVTETHIHADFASGARALAMATGATLHLSDEGTADWKYGSPIADGARLLHDGDEIVVGNVRLRAVHTPGHTPEHMAFLVTDGAAASEPIAMVTGDFVFVGDVGRPDLLERAANFKGTMEAGARTLYRSLQKFAAYPDWMQIWPGHGAGSACGKGLSAVPHSTVGYERRFNWAFSIPSEEAFVAAVLEGQPEPPRYFAEMKRINKTGAAPFDFGVAPPVMSLSAVAAHLRAGNPVVDVRPAADFAAGHLPGTLNIPLNRSFNTWAGALLPYDHDLLLIVPGGDAAMTRECIRELAMIALDRVVGVASDAVIGMAAVAGTPAQLTAQWSPADVNVKAGVIALIDVRGRSEWADGHIPGAIHIPLAELQARMSEVPTGQQLVMHCQGGGRSAIAASVLQAAGYGRVANMTGGFDAWKGEGLGAAVGSGR
ncbi:MAG: MBL fold metallo-hydrolase [Gemmatimonadetes bacterium]|nr:MBL fold metallo-hydrolase [Gemmatimonadota bacterium]